jgi:hypothetical protein
MGESVSSDQSFPDLGWNGVAEALMPDAVVGSGLLIRSASELPAEGVFWSSEAILKAVPKDRKLNQVKIE